MFHHKVLPGSRSILEGHHLSLNFTFTAPTWIDIFSAVLRSRLAQSDEWRETADGLVDGAGVTAATEKFDSLLSALKDEMPTWQAADFLAATEMSPAPDQEG